MAFRALLRDSPLAPLECDVLSDLDALDSWVVDGIKPNAALTGKRIVIIGGSFAGLMTALALQKQGLHVSVYERLTRPREGGAGIGIEDTSLACFEAFGLGEEIRKSASLPMRQQIHRTNDKEVFRSPYPYVSCYWNDIYRMIYDALPAGTVHLGKNFAGYSETAEGALTVSFDDGETVACDALIGCDGPTSKLRQLLHPECGPRYRGYTAWRGYLDKDLAPRDVIDQLYSYYETLSGGGLYFHVGSPESGHLVVYELPANAETGRKINLLWYVPMEKHEAMLGTGKDVGRDKRITATAREEQIHEMRAAARKFWPKAVADYIALVPEPFMNDIYDMDPLPSWGRGAITLVGDAAHPVTPHFLKSSNMAICDATELALRLSRATELQEAFRSYEEFRRPVTSETVLMSRHLGMLRQGLAQDAPQSAKEWEALSGQSFSELANDGRFHTKSPR